MTRIAVFCDGTWNSPDISETTHVHKLQRAVRHDPTQGQVSVYFRGIGTVERFDGPVKRFVQKWGGGAFGWGLDAKVKEAYQFIAQVYQPGDEIYLFGFSRGAFTARSVAGMIRKCGIVEDTTPAGINAAFALYRKRGARNHPDKRHIQQARRAMSPRFGTSQDDLAWRADGSELVQIAYVGVWDTVGARGLPLALLGPVAALWNLQYKFHDMKLSSLVKSARHAVALDEMRRLYRPALWDNVAERNGDAFADPLRPYQQVWFVGNHGVVGGSGQAQRLSAITGDWILQGAGRLALDPAVIYPILPPDPLEDTEEVAPKSGWLSAWRKGPNKAHDLHDSVNQRRSGRSDYNPGSLKRLFGR
ncbi:DUF2235 domain-containing protein [Aliishimia ponticola]|uniref:DUF2235 domain-containing protein n=1 Tax=Aliishimia ponticola TaxID=2499833 RepID=A0A4S4NHD0_9RHOB|nr:DUF2235 domain-containing protein [Aliishimia ponticola]THH38255.1 DUF2235 domain-containing protein [Aliishimia ponticola]